MLYIVLILQYEYFDNGGTMAENSGLGYIAASVLHSPLSFVGSTVLEYSTGDKAGSLNEVGSITCNKDN